MNKMEKAKKFVKEHWKSIVGITGGIGLTIVGGVVGWKMHERRLLKNVSSGKEVIYPVLTDALENLPGASYYGGIHEPGFTPKDLGKLGEKIREAGAPEDAVLSHFTCMGPKYEK